MKKKLSMTLDSCAQCPLLVMVIEECKVTSTNNMNNTETWAPGFYCGHPELRSRIAGLSTHTKDGSFENYMQWFESDLLGIYGKKFPTGCPLSNVYESPSFKGERKLEL